MLLLDFSQCMFSNLMANIKPYGQGDVFNEDMLRHMILNSLRSYRQKFPNYGELIIVCDSRNYWRKQIFPFYKASRKKFFEQSKLDWEQIFISFHKIKEELKEYFPYKVLEIETAEADDIIGTIVEKFGWNKMCYSPEGNKGCKILILSGDHDHIQLHKYSNVKQYDPVRKKWIEHEFPEKYLIEHIMKGDIGDGIPSILCEDDYYMNKSDQDHKIKRLSQKKINFLLSKDKESWPTEIQRNFDRNASLISYDHIPLNIKEEIINQYNLEIKNNRSQLMTYFIKYKLRNLFENIQDF